ncbi:fructosamine kinase family protein [Commensalibacter oyaizuii]|uniref:Fructosamine kinase family protein n=1 Tax=Commensalibacter oyaizuii TaxID=3043873 RepID=A0ABT6PYJ2_9PROT|nr:fructosamine kinase family protein [Commensalibacter sp. TBRC 16381]MDI2089929.1 fructosamine kinase family protein [Commensalibacter sp. TBRC 16381]
MNKISPLLRLAEQRLNQIIEKAQPLTQGDLSDAYLITTNIQQSYVIKNGHSPKIEADMLRFLAKHHIDVPKVIFADSHILILEVIQETNCLSQEAWQNLGETITKLHQIQHQNYGWHEDYAFDRVPLHNQFCDNWVEFWGNYRLACYLENLPIKTGKQIEILVKNLHNYIPTNPTPSLLHGDLWTGNILTNINRSYLIDPACYFGHNEVDIAMLNIFGSPPSSFYKHYPLLNQGWEDRLPIYQLFPALVHYILFGDYYLNMIHTLLNRLKV